MKNTLIEMSRNRAPVTVPAGRDRLSGYVYQPRLSRGMVILAQGSGSKECSQQNSLIAGSLKNAGFTAVRLELLTEEENSLYEDYGNMWFDTRLLARRLANAAEWLQSVMGKNKDLKIGCFACTIDAPVALIAATQDPALIRANVLLSGQSALAISALSQLKTPTLFLASSGNEAEVSANREAFNRCHVDKKLVLLTERSRHPGTETMNIVSRLSQDWFTRYLGKASSAGE